MTIVGIDHVQLAMPAGGEEEARRFYSGLLEIPEVAKPEVLAQRGGVWFERHRRPMEGSHLTGQKPRGDRSAPFRVSIERL